jgi:S1-C subfamily serine protease
MSEGRVRRAWLGVGGLSVPLPTGLAAKTGLRAGLRVVEVVPGSPAAAAGIFLGDVVISAGGRPVTTAQDLQRLMIATEVGRALPVTVHRKGALVDVVAELAELPAT